MRCATRDRGPRKRAVQYVEEAGGTRLRVAQHGQGANDFVAAVENLCMIRVSLEQNAGIRAPESE